MEEMNDSSEICCPVQTKLRLSRQGNRVQINKYKTNKTLNCDRSTKRTSKSSLKTPPPLKKQTAGRPPPLVRLRHYDRPLTTADCRSLQRSVLISDTELPSDLIMWWVRRTRGGGGAG